jgi:ribosomal protein S3AE
MKSNYSLLKDLPEFNSGRKEKFSQEKLPSLDVILMNLDSFKQKMIKNNEIRANMNQRINEETNEENKNQYINNLVILDRISSNTNEDLKKFTDLLRMVDKKELIDLMETLESKQPNLTKYDSRILEILKGM